MGYDIGPRLRKYREAQNLSQKEFANLIGVSNSRVSNWEQGINRPDVDILAKICEILKVPPSELLDIQVLPDDKSEYGNKTNELILTPNEKKLVSDYRRLNSIGQDEALKRVEELTYIDKYKSSTNIPQDIEEKKPEKVYIGRIAAYGGNGVETIEITEEQMQKYREEMKKIAARKKYNY